MAAIPRELIRLERSSEVERARLAGLKGEEFEAQRQTWRTADEAFHAAVTEYAARKDVTMSREAVEREVRNAARRADEDPAVE
ncbi:hypothetical protein [Streptomyces sp. NPDC059828]|uniref:hypothetical protein n=1 Tax=Streptomyces sp. NPDC059828 TaxID=3346965 RepID=UPI00364F72F4